MQVICFFLNFPGICDNIKIILMILRTRLESRSFLESRQIMKKALSLLLVLVMLFGVGSMTATAAEGTDTDS